jgi:Nucleotidyltransferase
VRPGSGQLPIDEQLEYFLAALRRNDNADRGALTRGSDGPSGVVPGCRMPLPDGVERDNQARVHLWFEQKFGVPCGAHDSAETAIDTFESTAVCLGVRQEPDGRLRVYAPRGLSDVFNLVVRPNRVLAARGAYEAKAARWRSLWPALTVLAWPCDGAR